jgi:hypothetical protein
LVVGVVFTVFDVRSYLCSCLLAINVAERQVVGADGVWRCVYNVFVVLVVLIDPDELEGVLI